jgi:tetratricopeptide (TPR) repeat protein
MSLRQRISCSCFSVVLALPSVVPQAASGQTQPATVQLSSVHPPDRPLVPVSFETQGDLFTVRGRYLDAIEAYRQDPQAESSPTIANKIGVAYHHMFDLVDAKKSYERAIALDPRYAEAYNNLGAVYHAEKNYRKAQHYYKKAIKLNPRSPLFYSNLGTSYFLEGNTKKGAEQYAQAFALDPQIFEHGSAMRVEEASSSKDLAAANYVLAKTYAQAGKNDRALEYLRKALAEGFSDRKKLMTDRELASLRETPEFQALLSSQRTQ